MLLGREIAQRFGLFGVQVADGDTAQKRHDRMAVAVEVDRRGRVGVGGFIGNVDFRIDADGQNLVRAVGIIAVVMNVRVAFGHLGVLIHPFGRKRLHGQRSGAGGSRAQAHRRNQRHHGRQAKKSFLFHVRILLIVAFRLESFGRFFPQTIRSAPAESSPWSQVPK